MEVSAALQCAATLHCQSEILHDCDEVKAKRKGEGKRQVEWCDVRQNYR